MNDAIRLQSHPDFTADELIELSGWHIPSAAHRENLAKALTYFQRVVPKAILRAEDDAGPWNLRIWGVKIRLINWLQGLDLGRPVDPNRMIKQGENVIAFKDPSVPLGQVQGNWYTFPGAEQNRVAIHSSLTSVRRFKAKVAFTCLLSEVADAHVAWLREMPAEYRRGGARQLFIWNARNVLEPS